MRVLSLILVLLAALAGTVRTVCGQAAASVANTSDLLRAAPFDRLTLIDGSVWLIDPVSPRPLPAYDPSKERERRKRESENPSLKLVEIGRSARPAPMLAPSAAAGESHEPADEVKIHLLQAGAGEVRDYKIKRASIKKIEYFEDMLLEEADQLVLARDYARAFECCLRVQTRNPGWKGLDDHVNGVLFAEGKSALIEGDGERGVRLLRELLGRKPDYPGLHDQLAAAYGKRVERAIAMGLHAQGRRVLHELEEIAPQHVVVRTLHAVLAARAEERKKAADSPGVEPAARLDALTDALRIWPTLAGAEAEYRRAFAVEPTLDVGVTDVANPLGPWIHSRADARVSRLLYQPILARDDEASRQGKTAPQLAASIESSDLGRRLLIRIRSGWLWSDESRPASAADVAHALVDRSDPHSPNYDARWADLLDRVELPDDTRVELRLNYTPLKAGGWLLGPVAPAHAGIDGRVANSASERTLVTSGPYRAIATTEHLVELRLREGDRAASDRNPGGAASGIRRLREIRLSQGQAAVAALVRGDVTLIDHVPPDQVASLAAVPELHVGRYSALVVHVIALDGRHPALRSRALRRGLSYAVDRKNLLEGTVLRRSSTEADVPADGPFPTDSYANAQGVKQLAFDLVMAKMLVAAARKELGGSPIALRLEYPAVPEVRAVIGKLADAFRAAGVEIATTELGESRLETELRAGRRFDLAYRIVRCAEPILDAGPALCPGYDAPPQANTLASAASPRILQLLLQLEHAAEWPTARALAMQIDREARDELPVIPLWQLVDHFAWRDRLKGPADVMDDLFQGIETWQIAPWVAHDPWEGTEKLSPE
jgi:peptide/nickel transport system substrate-binding protein